MCVRKKEEDKGGEGYYVNQGFLCYSLSLIRTTLFRERIKIWTNKNSYHQLKPQINLGFKEEGWLKKKNSLIEMKKIGDV